MKTVRGELTWTLGWSGDFSDLLFSILTSWSLAFFSRPATRLSVTGCFSACANMDPRDDTGRCCRPGCPGTLAGCWLGELCLSFSFSPSSISAPFSDGLLFLCTRPLARDEGTAE